MNWKLFIIQKIWSEHLHGPTQHHMGVSSRPKARCAYTFLTAAVVLHRTMPWLRPKFKPHALSLRDDLIAWRQAHAPRRMLFCGLPVPSSCRVCLSTEIAPHSFQSLTLPLLPISHRSPPWGVVELLFGPLFRRHSRILKY
jgi:hypothetical protein